MSRINWKSLGAAFMASLAMLAALPYSLGDIATIIPPAWKGHVAIAALIAAFLLRAINSIKPKE